MAIDAHPGLLGKLTDGLTLPASWYSDPAMLRLEQEHIFKRSWQYVGTTTDVAEPGMFFTCRLGDVPVVVLRDKQGELRGHVNVCRHRGHEVVAGCGKRETLQCPYHAWTFELDGSLRAAPRSDREPGFDASEWSLRPVLVETWGPLVFVNPCLEAAPLEETLGSLPEMVKERGLDPTTLEYRGRSREWIVNANWKLAVENYLECYHCPVAHKSFSRLIDVDPDEYALSTSRWSSSQLGKVHHQVDAGTRSDPPLRPGGTCAVEPVPLRVAELDAQHLPPVREPAGPGVRADRCGAHPHVRRRILGAWDSWTRWSRRSPSSAPSSEPRTTTSSSPFIAGSARG